MPTLDEAIGDLYACSASREPWRGALDALARAAGFDALHLLVVDGAAGGPRHHEGSRDLSTVRARRIHRIWSSGRRAPAGLAIRPLAASDGAATLLVATAERDGPRPPAAARQAALDRIQVHVSAAIDLRLRAIRRETDVPGLGAALDWLAHPIAIVDGRLGLLHVNASGRVLLREAGFVAEREARLDFAHPPDAVRIAAACRASGSLLPGADDGVRIERVHDADGARAGLAFVSAIADGGLALAAADARALIVFHPATDAPALDPRRLAEVFDLSQTESRIVAHLAAGGTVAEVVAAHAVTLATVRTQLRSIFGKTGTRSQSDLVRVVAGLPALRTRGTAPR